MAPNGEIGFIFGYAPNISFLFNTYSFGSLTLGLSLLSPPKLRAGLGPVG